MTIPNISNATTGAPGSAVATEKGASFATARNGQGSGSFADLVHAGAQQAAGLESQAQSAVVGLLRGEGVEVHGAMIATQQAELAFELALQVRNKAVAAYQQMMQMQF